MACKKPLSVEVLRGNRSLYLYLNVYSIL